MLFWSAAKVIGCSGSAEVCKPMPVFDTMVLFRNLMFVIDAPVAVAYIEMPCWALP